ncbi:M10 family metallopeptidase C-terminal domain-containing protein [Sphingomonas sp. SUN039]|uniref:beta strand repeat-containing protein n=1 Tax=Sphingomonas sp. SUN039 TaxID=2937787 RepID=UPI0021649C6F|nr:M10 family metallopeptidase C-terminal domain-containing protein [Sphingomonas sp. SUN039]UVO55787.1 M10 family metallopeptidase C-terminal domain-containing protein [Sphingomonas sp. SUN039]
MPTTTGGGQFENRGDTDWFRARFESGKTYVVNFTGTGTIYLILPNGDRYRPPVEFGNVIRFVAPTTGDYFVVAEGNGAAGSYSITAQDYADPIPASTATASTLAVGGSFTSALNSWTGPSYNEDWHQITLTAGTSYALAGGNTDRVYILDSTGSVVAIESQGQQYTLFTPATSGTYYAAIQSSTSQYTLSLNSVTDDRGASTAFAGSFAVGTPTTGTLDANGDDDWFAVTLTAGQSYRLLMNTGANTTSGKYLEVRDASGALLTQTAGTLVSPETIFSPTTTGTYYVSASIWGAGGVPGGGIAYTLSASTIADLTDNVLTTGTLAVGGSSGGSWQSPGDRDWYAMTLTAGTSYGVGVSYAGGPGGSPGIAVYNSAGVLIPLATEVTGTTASTHFTAPTTGAYYVAAVPPNFSSGTVGYTVIAAALADDLPNTNATTGTIAVGGTASGTAESSIDADWFAVTLTGGLIYKIDSPDFTSGVAIRNAAGQLLTTAGIGDEVFSPTTTGTYYLEAIGGSGAYTVRIAEILNDFGAENSNTFSVLRESSSGTAGPDTLNGSSDAHEQLNGGDGDDLFLAGAGYDFYLGGNNVDTLSFANYTVGANVSLFQSASFVGGLRRHTISQVENVTGSDFDDTIRGNSGNNVLNGGNGNDTIDASDGGNDTLIGGIGNDSFNFGAAFTALDSVDGGAGTNDQIGLSGNYSAGLTLGATSTVNVEVLAVLPGFSYSLTSIDANVAAGQELVVFAGNLAAGENFTFNGSAEADGRFRTYGGLGTDTITGGALDDGFYFGPGKWGAGDVVVGGGGTNDQLALDGSYTVSVGTSADVETLALLAGPVGTPNTFNITLLDAWTAAAATKTVWGAQVSTAMTIDGSAETNGNLVFFGGSNADTLTGGAGADTISGGGGGDALRGNGGADIFRYDSVTDSNGATNATRDRILDFTTGSDKIDLSRIDAINGGADDAFSFIGSSAFGNVAGQLRYTDSGGGVYIVEGDVNGDGVADFTLSMTMSPATPPVAADFVL